eukprot:s1126_g3.t1
MEKSQKVAVSHGSPANREHELGLDSRETDSTTEELLGDGTGCSVVGWFLLNVGTAQMTCVCLDCVYFDGYQFEEHVKVILHLTRDLGIRIRAHSILRALMLAIASC